MRKPSGSAKSAASHCSEIGEVQDLETLKSRQNPLIRHFRALSADAALRREEGLFVCDGGKLLEEALREGINPRCVLWKDEKPSGAPRFQEEYLLDGSLFDYVSPMTNSPGPLFTVPIPVQQEEMSVSQALVLEELQDPGNVGTILRTADAFGIDCVILLEGCADLYAPRTVRATMGAIFRQKAIRMKQGELLSFCERNGLHLWAAALSPRARDLREVKLSRAAVCIGSEGHGLSGGLLALCENELIIPMRGKAESLNAAIAASVIMWEMQR